MDMAGPQPEFTSGQEIPDPYLDDFTRLGQQIYLYTPAAASAVAGSDVEISPALIIVCSWMYAQSRYIKKYTSCHQKRFPASPILLLRQDGGDFFWRTSSQQINNLQPALSVIRELTANKRNTNVLMHVFSNGGSWTACQLAQAYRTQVPDQNQLLPITALILDSTPSLPSAAMAYTALCEALPKTQPLRAIGSTAIWCYIHAAQAVDSVFGRENLTMSLRRKLNDPEGPFMQDGLKRLYIYSQADALIPGGDVEAHAREAAAIIGENRVQLEDFVTSRHVGHGMLDPEKYWSLVDALWDESEQK